MQKHTEEYYYTWIEKSCEGRHSHPLGPSEMAELYKLNSSVFNHPVIFWLREWSGVNKRIRKPLQE